MNRSGLRMLPPDRRDFVNHAGKADFQRLLDDCLADSLHIWRAHGGIIPFGAAILVDGRIAQFGGPAFLPDNSIGIIEAVIRHFRKIRSSLIAVVRITEVYVRTKDGRITALRADLEHRLGPPLVAYYPLPNSDRWWVEAGESRILI